MKMKMFALLSGVISLGAVGTASAADMAVKARPAPPPPVAVYNWTGFYIGANGGGGWSHKCWDNFAVGGVLFPVVAEGCHDASGGTVGGQIGYRWQATNWVFGLEAQGNWADISGSNNSLFFNNPLLFPGALANHSKIDAFGLFTGQIGYAWNNVLWYVKGGAAVTRDKFESIDIPTGLAFDRASDTRWGGVVGTGLEFGFAPNWSLAIEYDHLFMGHRDIDLVFANPAFGVGLSRGETISQNVDIVTARINYRFGPVGGPVVARY
jgi:outer membrane immunogenic protein